MINFVLKCLAAILAVGIFFSLTLGRRHRPLLGAGEVAAVEGEKMLIFSKTAGYRHRSIQEGNALLEELAQELGLVPVITEDAEAFTARGLSGVKLVVFNNTTGSCPTTAFRGCVT